MAAISEIEDEIRRVLHPIVSAEFHYRGKFHRLPEPVEGTGRFIKRIGYSEVTRTSSTIYYPRYQVEQGQQTIYFHTMPPDGGILKIGTLQYLVDSVDLDAGSITLSEPLAIPLGTASKIKLIAVRLNILDFGDTPDVLLLSKEFPVAVGDVLQVQGSVYTVDEVIDSSSKVTQKIRLSSDLYNDRVAPYVFLTANPYYKSEIISLASLPEYLGPFLLEIPVASHLHVKKELSALIKFMVNDTVLFEKVISSLSLAGTPIIARDIPASAMTTWTKVTGSMGFDGNKIILTTDEQGIAKIYTECVPAFPTEQVNEYRVSCASASLTGKIIFDLYPNETQEAIIESVEFRQYRFKGPAQQAQPIQRVGLTFVGEPCTTFTVSGIFPDIKLSHIQYAVTPKVTSDNDDTVEDFDVLFKSPIVKPYFLDIRENYIKLDIHPTDSGLILGD